MARALHPIDMIRHASALLVLSAFLVGTGCSGGSKGEDACTGAASALRTCAKGTTLEGIDVSKWQGTVDWSKVRASGREFAFARVSDGLNYVDQEFPKNWPAMKSVGLVRGAYQFFRSNLDPKAQADLLLAKINEAGGIQPGDLPPVIDIETTDNQTNEAVVANAKIWIGIVEKAVGMKPIVYTSARMSPVIGTNFSSHVLWVANYQVTCPLMPDGWSEWQFWQSSESGSVPGVNGPTDINHFNGNKAQLLALTIPPKDGPAIAPEEEPKKPEVEKPPVIPEPAPDDPCR